MDKKISKHHDDSLYYECLAKIILENRFKNWNLQIADKPDLQDFNNKIGVEVTQVLPYGCNQALSLMQDGKNIEGTLKEKGYELVMPGMLIHPTKSYVWGEPFPQYNYLVNGIKNKIDKIDSYRNDFNELDLYVFTDNLNLDKDTINTLFHKILEINNNAFDNIFIDACYKIFVLKKEYAYEYVINRQKYTDYQYKAIDMEEGIKNE